MHTARMLLVANAVELPLLVLAARHPQSAFARELRQFSRAAKHGTPGTDKRVSVLRADRLQPIHPLLEHKRCARRVPFDYSLQIIPRFDRDVRAGVRSV